MLEHIIKILAELVKTIREFLKSRQSNIEETSRVVVAVEGDLTINNHDYRSKID